MKRIAKEYWPFILLAAFVLLVLIPATRAATITLPAGPANVAEFTAGNVYVGTPGKTTITSTAPSRVTGSNVTVRGVKFITGGIRRDGDFSTLLIDNCEFESARVGVEIHGGSGVTIRQSRFSKCNFTSWIVDQKDLLIESNESDGVGYGWKVFGDSQDNRNWTARLNLIKNCGPDFMAFEWQGACRNWVIEDNLIELIKFGPNLADNDHSLIISAPMAKSVGPGAIRRNTVICQKPKGPGYPDAWINGPPAIVEAGGTDTVVEKNILIGGGVGITVTDKDGTASVTIRNNRVSDVYSVHNKDSATQVVTATNNGASVDVGFTIESLRAKVGRAGSSLPQGNPPPAGQINIDLWLHWDETNGWKITPFTPATLPPTLPPTL